MRKRYRYCVSCQDCIAGDHHSWATSALAKRQQACKRTIFPQCLRNHDPSPHKLDFGHFPQSTVTQRAAWTVSLACCHVYWSKVHPYTATRVYHVLGQLTL